MNITILPDAETYAPGEILSGTVAWFCDKAPQNIIIELLWETSGRGTKDSEVVYSEKIPCSSEKGEAQFSFQIPNCPPSYRGKLVSISYQLKASADIKWAIDPKSQVDLIISKTGEAYRPFN
jgi:hypothetical protein